MSAVVFSPQEDEIFIEFVRKYPILYDSSHMQYKNLIMKDSIWKEISQNIGKSIEDCKKRWKNIRDSYNRNKRKLGTGSERSMKKKWSLAPHVSFLDTVEHERSSSTNVTELPEGEEISGETEEEFDGRTEEDKYDEITTNPGRIRSKQDKLAMILGKRSLEQKKLIDQIQAQNETILNSKTIEDDDIDLFFKSLAKTVKKLPKKGINEVKLKTLTLVSEIEEKYAAFQQTTSNVTIQRFFNEQNENTERFQISPSNTSSSSFPTSEILQGFTTYNFDESVVKTTK